MSQSWVWANVKVADNMFYSERGSKLNGWWQPTTYEASTIPYNHQAEGVEQPLLKLHGIAMGYRQPKIVNGIPQKRYMIHF